MTRAAALAVVMACFGGAVAHAATPSERVAAYQQQLQVHPLDNTVPPSPLPAPRATPADHGFAGAVAATLARQWWVLLALLAVGVAAWVGFRDEPRESSLARW